MGKGPKGLIKRIGNGLKCLPAFISIAAIGGGVLGFFGGLTSSLVYGTKFDKYQESEIYATLKEEDIKEVERAYKAEEIGEYDYNKKREYMDGNKYAQELAQRDVPENEYWQGLLKGLDISKTVMFSSLGSFFGGGVLTWAYLSFVDVDRAWLKFAYGDDDEDEDDEPREPISPKQKQKNKAIVDDISTGEEKELQSTEDNYYKV